MSRRDVETLARHLETRAPSAEAPAEVRELAALARVIETRALAPRPQFRADLRAMLLAEAAAPKPAAWRQRLRDFVEDGLAGLRTTGRLVAAAGVAAVVLVVAGLGAATNMAVPGDFLHTVKVRLEDQRIDRAESVSQRGALLLQSASNRVDEAERSAAGDRPASAGLALEAADVRAREGAQALLSVALGTGDRTPLAALERFSADHRPRVERLAGTLAGDPGQAARDLLTTLERIDARVEALAAGCCPMLTGLTDFVVDGVTDLSVIPPAWQPFDPCPCPPSGAAAPERLESPAGRLRGEAAAGSDRAPAPLRQATEAAQQPEATADGPPGHSDGPGLVDRARDAAEQGATGAVTDVQEAVEGAVGGAGDAVTGATGDAVTGATGDLRDGARETLEDPVGTATGEAKQAGGTVEEAVDTVGEVADEVEDVVDGVGSGIGGQLP